jgi:hypothetical protein
VDGLLRGVETVQDTVSEAFFEPVIRLGVTGLARSGKTVFIRLTADWGRAVLSVLGKRFSNDAQSWFVCDWCGSCQGVLYRCFGA